MHVPHQLETDRLILRRMIPEDIQPFADFVADEEATKYMAFPADQKNLAGVQSLIDLTINLYDTPQCLFVLTITLKGSDEFIGALGTSPDTDIDAAEIFYAIIPEHQGKGYATEGTQCLIDYLFHTEDIERIAAYIMPDNHASVQVATRLGMQSEGPVSRDGFDGDLYLLDRS